MTSQIKPNPKKLNEPKQPQIISPQNLIKLHKNKFENLTPTAHTGLRISPFYVEKLTQKKNPVKTRESKTKKTKREIYEENFTN